MTPIEHSIEVNDMRQAKTLAEGLGDDAVIYTEDVQYMQTQYQQSFIGSFSFYEGMITHFAKKKNHILGDGFQGSIKEKIVVSPTRMITNKLL